MVQGFHLDANSFSSQLKNVFFQVAPDEIPGPCQKFFFQSKNSNRSKQTTAKCNQIRNLGFGLGNKSKLF